LNPKNVRNPYLQRLYHSLQHRALHPDDPLPPVDQNLLANLNMPAELVKRSDAAREKVKLLFPLKKMEKKKFHKNFAAE
jgi:ATP-dependent DNA helicase 2 subunit 2